MIQRIQTLFLLEMAFLSVSLLFIPVQIAASPTANADVSLMLLKHEQFLSSTGHMAAVAINFTGMVLCFVTIFLYRKRELQVKLCYVLLLMNLILLAMIIFCPFVQKNAVISTVHPTPLGHIIPAVIIVSAFLAARFIKKDIALLKSADRIR